MLNAQAKSNDRVNVNDAMKICCWNKVDIHSLMLIGKKNIIYTCLRLFVSCLVYHLKR